MFNVHVLTLFPELFPGPLGHSITGRALKAGLWACAATNIRDFATDKHRTVDDTPYGGGAGMVMRADVVAAAIRHARAATPGAPVVYLSPSGRPFGHADAVRLSQGPGLVLLCGHYEGIDERVLETEVDEQISIGDYVLTGGELAALVVADAVVRQKPGVLGNADGLTDESFSRGLLEYPQYTRPDVWEGHPVPDILKTGHHAKVAEWRHAQAQARTAARRPDLWHAWQKAQKPKT